MQVARVAVEDEQWRAFRALALARDISVSGYLGRLVSAELTRRRAWSLQDPAAPEVSELERALSALAEVRAGIDEMDEIAGRLARSAVAFGASWQQVGSPLRLPAETAQHAFGRTEGR